MNHNVKISLSVCSFFMALVIALGAFGAHLLKNILSYEMLKIYNIGIEYHFYNILGLFAVIFIYNIKNTKKIFISMILIFIGMNIFSFSLYFLAILDIPILGAITPIGGTILIIGWLFLSYGIIKD